MNRNARALADDLADAIERGDVGRIGVIVDANLWILIQSHWALLQTALGHLPEEFFDDHPKVALVQRFGTSVFLKAGGVNERTVTAVEGGDGSGMTDQLLDAILLQEMLAHRLRGEFASAKGVADRLRARVERTDDRGQRPVHDMVAFYLLHVGITEALAGNLDQSLRDFANARILRPDVGGELTEYDALLKGAAVQAALGRLVEAERSLRLAGEPPELGEPFASQLAATKLVARALIAVDRLDSSAPELVQAALEQSAAAEMWPFALLASTRWSIATGDLLGAIDQVDRADTAQPVATESLLGRIVSLTRVQALALMGEFGAALHGLELDSTRDGARLAAVIRARLTLYTEGPEAALTAARQLVVRPGLGPSARAETMLIAAWAQTELLGEPDGATAGPLGALIAREGLWRVLQLVPERVAALVPGLESAAPFQRQLVHFTPSQSVSLTANELEVLHLLAGPDSLAAIAKGRFVSVNTVKTQVQSIYRRLGVNGRREAVAEAIRRGIFRGTAV